MGRQDNLKHFYLKRCADLRELSPLDVIVSSFLNEEVPDPLLLEQTLSLADSETKDSPWFLVKKWQEILTLLIIVTEFDLLPQYRSLILHHLHKLNASFLWEEFQLISTYRAICSVLLNRTPNEMSIHQLPGGACPLECGRHWTWGTVPHLCFHAELGILWCFYGQLTGNSFYLTAAERLAEWQLNTLDHAYAPYVGLYSQEGDTVESLLLIHNMLLFGAVAEVSGRSDMAWASIQQRDRLKTVAFKPLLPFPHLVPILERQLIHRAEESSPAAQCLPLSFADKDLIMAGCRSSYASAVATMSGGGSGMGSLSCGDVQIVNYGPQYLPLGDCRGFGIESCPNTSSKVEISASEDSFLVEGMSRVASRPNHTTFHAGFRNGKPSGFWIDARQRFEKGNLWIDTIFRRVYDLSHLAFVFFVKGGSCVIDGSQIIKPRSFGRYQGEERPVVLNGEHSSLVLEAGQNCAGMQVIPLGGGSNFWGADFLVAYFFDSQKSDYSWSIRLLT